MKRSLLVAVSCLTLAGCASQSVSHYSVTPQVRVIERTTKKTTVTPVVVAGSAGDVR